MNDKTMHENPNLITKLSQNLNVRRKENKFCDFTIKSKDGKTLSVHKNVLDSLSTFFEKMFDSGMREAIEDSMVLDKISGDNLERIVEYMYTGRIHVTFENAREIFDAALFLGFDDLVEFSTKVLIGGINEENVWSLLEFGETMTDYLKNACFKWIFENLELVAESKDVENLCFDTIKEIMIRKNEFDLCEDKFHTMIMKWFKFDEETRKYHAKELIECLRFDFMSKEYLMSDEMLETADLIDDRNFSTKILKICREYGGMKYKQMNSCSSSSVAGSRSNGNSLYVVTEKNIYKFDPNTKKLSKHCNIPYICNTDIRCVGGDDNGSFFTIWYRYVGNYTDIKMYPKERDEWTDIPKLKKSDDFDVMYYKNKIFLYTSNSNQYQIFDLINFSWIEKANVSPKIACLCTMNDLIYAYGHDNNDDKDKLYRSDGKLSWECLSTLSNTPNILKIIGYDNYIYHFGKTGYCIFDVKKQRWFNDFVANEKDLADERKGIIIPFSQRANICIRDKLKNEWMINTKRYHENMEFRDVCLHKNEFYVTNGEFVQVYKAPFFYFSRTIPIEFTDPNNNYNMKNKRIKFLISN